MQPLKQKSNSGVYEDVSLLFLAPLKAENELKNEN
jgi:hypothetical protein